MPKTVIKKPKVPVQQRVNFSFAKMNELYDSGQLKDHLDCKTYILDYFIPTTKGTHVLNDADSLEIIQKDTFKEVYLKRFPKDIQKWFNTETIPKKLICDINNLQ